MDAIGAVLGWIAENEGLFSGLVAIAALVGIVGAGARLLWVRARRSGPRTAAARQVWVIGLFVLVVVTVVAVALVTSGPGKLDARKIDRAGPPTIAVLPFAQMSGSDEHEWLSDGLTEDIITLLAQSRAMQIIARNATIRFDAESADIGEVRRALAADFVVRGSVRTAGDNIRVTVQLIDTESGTHVWAEKYDRPLIDLFAVQDEIAAGIAAGVGDEIFKVEVIRARQAKPDRLDAWGQTWRADASWSVEDARAAILLDENYARSYAVLGRNLSLQTLFSTRDPEVFAEAVGAARRAVELAPEDVLVVAYLGVTLLWSGDPAQALVVLKRVPSMSPSYADGLVWYGDTLIHNGKPEEGLIFVERGIELAPKARSLWNYEVIKAEALIHLGRFDEAREILQHAILDGTVAYPFLFLAGVEALAGRAASARKLVSKAKDISPGVSSSLLRTGYTFVSTDAGGPNFELVFDALEATVP